MKYVLIGKNNHTDIKYVSSVLKEYFQNSSCEYINILYNAFDKIHYINDFEDEDNYNLVYIIDLIINGGEVVESIDVVSLLLVNNWLRAVIQHEKLKEELVVNKQQTIKRPKI